MQQILLTIQKLYFFLLIFVIIIWTNIDELYFHNASHPQLFLMKIGRKKDTTGYFRTMNFLLTYFESFSITIRGKSKFMCRCYDTSCFIFAILWCRKIHLDRLFVKKLIIKQGQELNTPYCNVSRTTCANTPFKSQPCLESIHCNFVRKMR